MTMARFEQICPRENIYIVTNEKYYNLIKEQLPQYTDEQIILEPMRRNTAPCIAYANYRIKKRNPEANIVVSPSDHVIFNEAALSSIFNRLLNVWKEIVDVDFRYPANCPDTVTVTYNTMIKIAMC